MATTFEQRVARDVENAYGQMIRAAQEEEEGAKMREALVEFGWNSRDLAEINLPGLRALLDSLMPEGATDRRGVAITCKRRAKAAQDSAAIATRFGVATPRKL